MSSALLKQFRRGGKLLRQIASHPDALGALAREEQRDFRHLF